MNTRSEIRKRLLEFGVKPSLQRIVIMEYLKEHLSHQTANVIFKDLNPSILALTETTEYNTIKVLEEQCAIHANSINEKNASCEADTSRQIHFKCKECDSIYDLPMKDISLFEISDSEDFLLTECHMYYKGYCKNCKEVLV